MTSLDITPKNKNSQSEETVPTEPLWKVRTKTVVLTLMIGAIATLGLLYNMEKEARTMERKDYERETRELKENIEKLQSSLLAERSQPSQ